MIDEIGRALAMAFAMGWEILWPLILGFAISAGVKAVVSHREMVRLLLDDRPRSIATALALGAASSSCSYAAGAIARSIFRKGADFTAARAFEMASINLVAELSILMLIFLGWRIALAEAVGAPLMVVLLVFLFRAFLRPELVGIRSWLLYGDLSSGRLSRSFPSSARSATFHWRRSYGTAALASVA